MQAIIQCIAAFFGCIGFSLVFRVHHHLRFVFIGSFGGMLGFIVYLLLQSTLQETICYLVAMSCVALYSEVMARVCKAPATIFNIIGCFPLVPGRGIYETMLYLVQGNDQLFFNSLFNTVAIAFSIALAILLVSTLFKVLKHLKALKLKRLKG